MQLDVPKAVPYGTICTSLSDPALPAAPARPVRRAYRVTNRTSLMGFSILETFTVKGKYRGLRDSP